MTISTQSPSAPPSLARDLVHLARYYLGRRSVLFVLAGFALAGGLSLNWGWLTAIGVAPILIGLAPCAAMCALGLCMNRAGVKSCSTDTSPRDDATAVPDISSDTAVPTGVKATPLVDDEQQASKERNTADA